MAALRHDPDCEYCHGTSVGVFIVHGRKVPAIPCPCGVEVDADGEYHPFHEARKADRPTDRLKRRA